jgi:hypothetical protein
VHPQHEYTPKHREELNVHLSNIAYYSQENIVGGRVWLKWWRRSTQSMGRGMLCPLDTLEKL